MRCAKETTLLINKTPEKVAMQIQGNGASPSRVELAPYAVQQV